MLLWSPSPKWCAPLSDLGVMHKLPVFVLLSVSVDSLSQEIHCDFFPGLESAH